MLGGADDYKQLFLMVPPKQPLAACRAPAVSKTHHTHTDRNTKLFCISYQNKIARRHILLKVISAVKGSEVIRVSNQHA